MKLGMDKERKSMDEMSRIKVQYDRWPALQIPFSHHTHPCILDNTLSIEKELQLSLRVHRWLVLNHRLRLALHPARHLVLNSPSLWAHWSSMNCVSVSSLALPFGLDALIELQFLSCAIIDWDQLPSWKPQHTPSLCSATHHPARWDSLAFPYTVKGT